jgi:archaellum component FlaC
LLLAQGVKGEAPGEDFRKGNHIEDLHPNIQIKARLHQRMEALRDIEKQLNDLSGFKQRIKDPASEGAQHICYQIMIGQERYRKVQKDIEDLKAKLTEDSGSDIDDVDSDMDEVDSSVS